MNKTSLLGLTLIALSAGCSSAGRQDPEPVKSNPTYYEDIAPIVQERCMGCHSEGNIAPFSLENYEQAKTAAGSMKAATQSRQMPPWGLDSSGECNEYRDDISLSDAQIALIANWADTGAPMGDPKNAPAPKEGNNNIDNVTATVGVPDAYTPSDAQEDDYRCFILDPKLSADKFLTAYAVHPGEPSEVHHVVVWALDSAADESAAEDQDAKDPGLGYSCFSGPGNFIARVLLGWAPGFGVTHYPEGTGLRLTAGRKLLMQVHYHRNGPAKPDSTKIDLALADSVNKEGFISGVGDYALNIPPGESGSVETADTPFPAYPVAYVHGVFPHMHKFGRTLRVDLLQGLAPVCLVDAPRYSYQWQRFYFYKESITIPSLPGSYRITCTYDTIGAKDTVHFGEGTDDEMCLAGFYFTF